MTSPLFKTQRPKLITGRTTSIPAVRVNTTNEAGGVAYSMSHEHALAQYVVTGMFDNTCYIDAKTQLNRIKDLANKCSNDFIMRLAVYAHEYGYMKDTPAYLLGYLMKQSDKSYFKRAFPRVITNGRMLRTFVQIIRSGTFGSRSFGTVAKKAIQNYLNNCTDKQIINASIGNEPSLKDIIMMVHPKANNSARNQLYRWVCGFDFDEKQLPVELQKYLKLQKDPSGFEELPKVPFQMYTSMGLTDAGWKAIFDISTWQQIRMNLATFNRHNVFNDFSYVNKAYERLTSREDILRSKVMPYSVFSAYLNSGDIPTRIKEALNTAVQISLENIPKINGKTVIAIDYSGSMDWRLNYKSSVRYIDIAAVFTAAIKFRNPNAEIVLFNTRAMDYTVNPGTTVMQLANNLSRLADGGTDCSSAFKHIYDKGRYNGMPDNIIMISDNQSWLGFRGNSFRTGTQKVFDDIRQINPRARLVNIDISPSSSSQTSPSENVLNISGFNDTVFKIVSDFFESNGSKTFWVDKIKAIEI